MELFDGTQAGVIASIRAQKFGKKTPPYIPHWDLASLHKLCQLAKLWSEAGFCEDAGKLAYWLRQFEAFPSLWCPEKEFNEENFFSQLDSIEPIPGDSPDFGLTLFQTPSLSAAFTLAGHGTSLGVIKLNGMEIRALGPQALPLSEPNRFGIKGRGIEGWTQCFALPEVWFHLNAECKENECQIHLRFVGLQPEMPLAFAFYVKAESCQVGNEVLKPKSLRRFIGEERRVKLNSVTLESSQRHKVHVIPLAGEGCFWNTEFLVAFEIHPFDSQTTFILK